MRGARAEEELENMAGGKMNFKAGPLQKVAADVNVGKGAYIADFVNLYGCTIGEESKVGPFVEIQKDVVIGRRCKISSHSFICSGVTVEDEVFIGHGVIFINDRVPRATTASGMLQTEADWQMRSTLVKKGASIGSGAVIMCDVTIGSGAVIGAGAVVLQDVPDGAVVAGNPARLIRPSSSTER